MTVPPHDPSQKPLAGRVVLVTGAGQGIGRAAAIRIALDGASVIVNDLGVALDGRVTESDGAASCVEEIRRQGGNAISDATDIADFGQASELIARSVDVFGSLDAIVNAAGIVRDRMIFNMSEEEWDAVIRVHLKGAFNLARHGSAYWRSVREGDYRLINVTSGAGLFGAPGQPNYAAAKAGVVGLTLSCANALKKYGVASIAVAPGARTRMSATVSSELAVRAGFASDAMTPANLGPGFSYLVSARSGWLNGRVVGLRGTRLQLYSMMNIRAEVVSIGEWTSESARDAFETLLKPAADDRGVFDDAEEGAP